MVYYKNTRHIYSKARELVVPYLTLILWYRSKQLVPFLLTLPWEWILLPCLWEDIDWLINEIYNLRDKQGSESWISSSYKILVAPSLNLEQVCGLCPKKELTLKTMRMGKPWKPILHLYFYTLYQSRSHQLKLHHQMDIYLWANPSKQ